MRTRSIIIVGVVATVVVLGVITAALVFFLSDDTEETQMTVHTSPLELQLSVDGEDRGTVEDGSTLLIDAGEEVEITGSHEGFEDYTVTEEVIPGEPFEVHIALMPQTEEAWELLETQDQLEAERRGTEQYLQESEEAYETFPILDEMPEEQQYFSAYQGLTEESEDDFAIHLYLYEGHEDQGRQDYAAWLEELGYSADDYETVEHIEGEQPPAVLPESPTMQDLEEADPASIEDYQDISAEGLDPDELASLFLQTTTTWEPSEDEHPHAGLVRAADLMTDDRADEVSIPENPTTTPAWRDAAAAGAVSYPWLLEYESTTANDGTVEVTAEVCWAWLSEDQGIATDGPRNYELILTEDGDTWAIDGWSIEDPDPFVDNSNGPCRLTD